MKTKKILLSAAFIAVSLTSFAQVGVGTTTPKGALQVTSTTSGVIIPQFADLTAIQAIKKADGTTALDTEEQGMQVYNIAEKKNYLWNGTAWVAASGSTGKFVDGTDPLDAVYMDGKVGINTANPVNKFHVNIPDGISTFNLLSTADDMTISDNSSTELGLYSASLNPERIPTVKGVKSKGTISAPAAVSDGDGLMNILAAGFDGTSRQVSSRITFYADDAVSSGAIPSKIGFYTGPTSATIDEAMTIRSSGNVGINNIDPNYSLDVNGTLASTNAIIGNNINLNGNVIWNNNGGDVNNRHFIVGFGNRMFIVAESQSGSAADTEINLQTQTAGNGRTTRMAIKGNGNIGIGTEAPLAKLHVNGYIRVASSDATADATPSAGMIRYNSSTNKFQGYVGGGTPGWVNLH